MKILEKMESVKVMLQCCHGVHSGLVNLENWLFLDVTDYISNDKMELGEAMFCSLRTPKTQCLNTGVPKSYVATCISVVSLVPKLFLMV